VGNLKTRTDARNITTTYGYDALNRILQKSYSDGTPTANYQYDAAGAGYSWGHLTQVANGNSTTNYVSIDPLGRVTASNQQTAGQTYGFSYYYNRAGSLYFEYYPDGRGISTAYDGANRPYVVTSSAGAVYVRTASYWPHGAVEKVDYGNNVWRTYGFNSRLQVNGLWDAINDNPSYFLFLENPITYGTTNNNGNIQSLVLYASAPGQPGVLTSYTENFTYDALNRLSSASDSGGWSRSFAYDPFGNGWASAQNGIFNPVVPEWNLYNTKNQIGSSPYDAAGNMLALPFGMTYAYDAENRLKSETNTNGLSATYLYDGDGRRVQKALSNGQTTTYVYDAAGELSAEYLPASTWSKDYIFFGGQVLAIENAASSPCQTCYLSRDHLGSVRMVTDASANVISRHDYLPFGDEIPGGVAARNSQFGASDNATQRFTGKERDSETGLDYFGARYYAMGVERFMSPDWSERAEPIPYADVSNPQSLNLYAYVANNPLSRADLDGHNWWDKLKNLFGWAGCWCEGEKAESAALRNLWAEQRRQRQELAQWRIASKNPAYHLVMAMAMGPLGPEGEQLEEAAAETTAAEEAAEGEAGQMATAEARGYAELAENADASLKRLSKSEIDMLREAGEDAEQIKKDIVGTHGSRYDLFKDTKSGEIVVKAKDGSGEAQPTGLNIKELRKQ
jgi:RHS repeat-associated protein